MEGYFAFPFSNFIEILDSERSTEPSEVPSSKVILSYSIVPLLHTLTTKSYQDTLLSWKDSESNIGISEDSGAYTSAVLLSSVVITADVQTGWELLAALIGANSYVGWAAL